MTRALVALVVVALAPSAGCARNAILEVEVELPPSPEERYALFQIRHELDFALSWGGEPRPGHRLEASGTNLARISVESEDESLDLHVKVRYCEDAGCGAPADDESTGAPASWFVVEQPFYVGHRTFWRERIEAVPPRLEPGERPDVVVIDRCRIEGCTGGTPSTFCRLDGTHRCEPSGG